MRACLPVKSPIVFCLAAMVTAPLLVQAKPTKKKQQSISRKQVNEVTRAVFQELAESSDPTVRKVAIEGQIDLGKSDRKDAIKRGLVDSEWLIKSTALRLVLSGKNRKQRQSAMAQLELLLKSADGEERARGLLLVDEKLSAKQKLKLMKSVAAEGEPDAKIEARKFLLAQGGSTAWSVIQTGLAADEGTASHSEAVEAFKDFNHPAAYKWSYARLHDMDAQGGMARDYLIRLDHKKTGRTLDKRLRKEYARAKEDFMQRLRLASIIGARGDSELVKDTLVAVFKPDYKAPKGSKAMAWRGLRNIRDLAILKRPVALRYKLYFGDLFANIEDDEEGRHAFAWLEAWFKDRPNDALIEVLHKCVRGDRLAARVRSLGALAGIKHRGSIAIFESALMEGMVQMRRAGAQGLASIAKHGDEQKIGQFLRKDPDEEVKLALISGLASIGRASIIGPLQFVITDRNRKIKMAAAKAIADTGAEKAITLLSLLKRDPDYAVRFQAWRSLMAMDVKRISSDFNGSGLSWLEPDQISTLGKDAKTPIDLLYALADKGNAVQKPFAISALQSRGEKAATRLLTLYEESGDQEVAAASLTALAEIRGAESLPTYQKAIKNEFGTVRAAAFEAIGRYGSKTLLPLTMEIVESETDPIAKGQAARAAIKLAGKKK